MRREVAGLIVDQGGEPVGMVANLTAQPQRALVQGLAGELLDEVLGPYEVAHIG